MVERSQRADARRNRARVLAAAQEAFAQEGLLVPLDEIARRAGVGAGTVYRHFATKEALFKEVVAERLRAILTEAHALISAEEPGTAFFGFFSRVVRQASFNHAVCDALQLETGINAFAGAGIEDDFDKALASLLRRAQDAGAVRPDVDFDDVRTLMTGCLLMEQRRGTPGRMVALACDALRPVTKPDPSRNETCEICDTILVPSGTGRPARYCSAACRQKAHRRRAADPNGRP